MNETHLSTGSDGEPDYYEIRIQGHLDDRWADWFAGMTIRRENGGSTRLTGRVVDQPALYGLLRKVRDLGMPLISVAHIEPPRAADSNTDTHHHYSD